MPDDLKKIFDDLSKFLLNFRKKYLHNKKKVTEKTEISRKLLSLSRK